MCLHLWISEDSFFFIIFDVFDLLKNDWFIANLTQCGEKAAFKMSADETLSEAGAWGSFILNSGQNEVQTRQLEIFISPAWLHKGN